MEELIEQGFVEELVEVKETTKPRWKVGSCVVHGSYNPRYFRIDTVQSNFDGSHFYNGAPESAYRDPTPEELSTYFR